MYVKELRCGGKSNGVTKIMTSGILQCGGDRMVRWTLMHLCIIVVYMFKHGYFTFVV